MPNGDPDFKHNELPRLESFFSAIAEELDAFSLKHNLLIDKYWHQFASWRFSFRHPKGGAACIEVMKEGQSVKIYCYWWLDKYDEFTRYSKRKEFDVIDRDDVTIDLLECRLREILAWEVDDWTDIKTDYREYWQTSGKEFIEKDVEKFPQPKV